MKLVNLTKQPLRLYDTEGEPVEIPPDARHIGVVALGEHQRVELAGGQVVSVNVRRVQGIKLMPEPEEDTLFIVPIEVAMALQGARDDVVYAAEEARVRDGNGELKRVTHLRRTVLQMPETLSTAERPGSSTDST